MKHTLFTLMTLACLFGTSCSNSDKKIQSLDSNREDDTEMNCWGIGSIQLDMDLSTLEQTVGKGALSMDSAYDEQHHFKGMVAKVWKAKPQEVLVYWHEKAAPFQSIDSLEIVASDSPYKFFNGVKIGTTLAELAALNKGEEITLSAFDNSHAAGIRSIAGKKLKGDLPCLGASFSLPDTVSAAEMQQLNTKPLLSSSDEQLNRLEPRICRISIRSI